VGAWQRRVARARGVGALLTGAITFVQWFGDRLRAWCDGISLHAGRRDREALERPERHPGMGASKGRNSRVKIDEYITGKLDSINP